VIIVPFWRVRKAGFTENGLFRKMTRDSKRQEQDFLKSQVLGGGGGRRTVVACSGKAMGYGA